jgi:hypothetical protein
MIDCVLKVSMHKGEYVLMRDNFLRLQLKQGVDEKRLKKWDL